MSLEFPQTFGEWYSILPALVTLLLGMAYFFAPRKILKVVGLEAISSHPEAIGEARSSFAGFLVGTAIVVVLFQQPGLTAMLGFAWMVTAIGFVLQIILNHRRDHLIYVRLAGAIALGAMALQIAGGPEAFFDLENMTYSAPASPKAWLPLVSAAFALLFGLACFVMPTMATGLLRLQKRETPAGEYDKCGGELRGVLGGFYLVVGGSALFFALFGNAGLLSGIFFLTLGFCWGLVAFGRMIAMLSDGGNNGFNWLSLFLEMTLSALAFLGFSGFLA